MVALRDGLPDWLDGHHNSFPVPAAGVLIATFQ